MNEISIEGLTERQSVLADIMWDLETIEEVDAFINTLPPHYQKECKVIVDLMIMATLDLTNTHKEDMNDAKKVLDKFKKR